MALPLLAATPSIALAQAFEGALGFGADARSGCDEATEYEVTSLSDYDYPSESKIQNTLRWAIEEEDGPRNIVFKNVSGVISLKKLLRLEGEDDACVYIDGRTADDCGIAIEDADFSITATHDIILRFLRFRSDPDGSATHGASSLVLYTDDDEDAVHDVVIDHCSIERSDDDDLNIWGNTYRITVQWCIIGDGRNGLASDPCEFGKASVNGGYYAPDDDEYLTMCYNLFTNSYSRMPEFAAKGRIDFYNNAIINMVTPTGISSSSTTSAKLNIMYNFYKYQANHPWGSGKWDPIVSQVDGGTNQMPREESLYLQGNYFNNEVPGTQWNLTGNVLDSPQGQANLPSNRQKGSAWTTDADPDDALDALGKIMARSGCRINGKLDEIDEGTSC